MESVCDGADDEQPYRLRTETGSLTALPLMTELSDAVMHWARRIPIPRWKPHVLNAFEVPHRDGAENGRLLALTLHPWCIGQPFRVKYRHEIVRTIAARDGAWIASGHDVVAAFGQP